MKKLISFILAVVMLVTAMPALLVTAETSEEPAFVIDGKLDKWYRSDDWALANEFYCYFNTLEDANMEVISKESGADNGVSYLPEFNEAVQVKIYAAYDDHYAYFYVDVVDPHIASAYINDDGSENAYSQYIENIDFYIDTDVNSCDGEFFDNCSSYLDADTHFRLIAHNQGIVDCKGEPKYIFEKETVLVNEKTGEPDYSAGGFFKHPDNTVPFHKYDEEGNVIGYGCETRVPLAYWYGETEYQEVYYNIAITNSTTTMDPDHCAITTGQRWWLAYDTGRIFYIDPDVANPFLNVENDDVTPPDNDDPIPPAIPMGDLNGDEKVDAKDALNVLKISVNKVTPTDEQKIAADVNEDTSINAKDALEVLKFSVNKPSALDKFYNG